MHILGFYPYINSHQFKMLPIVLLNKPQISDIAVIPHNSYDMQYYKNTYICSRDMPIIELAII